MSFEAYLWGIETILQLCARGCTIVWSLPMRNWNWPRAWNRRRRRQSLKPTYEELKQGREDNNRCWRWGFEAYLWGIETSLDDQILHTWCRVWSLPMRNWNYRATRPLQIQYTFEAYLWGIETTEGMPEVYPTIEFEAYLWGIETSKKRISGVGEVRLKPTYEELKLVALVRDRLEREFEAYLWGIETASRYKTLAQNGWFEAYLWGIETDR